MTKHKFGAGVILALVLQAAATLLWLGAAAQRIQVLEQHMAETRPVAERLARLEVRIDAVHAQTTRIEKKVDQL